jgi:hypothetical protein
MSVRYTRYTVTACADYYTNELGLFPGLINYLKYNHINNLAQEDRVMTGIITLKFENI